MRRAGIFTVGVLVCLISCGGGSSPEAIKSKTGGKLIDVSAYGARGDGSDQTRSLAAAVAAVNALNNAPAALYFPPGKYALSPHNGMESRTGLVVTASNVEIFGTGATIELLPAAVPYSVQFEVPANTTFYWNYFKILGSNVLVHDLAFDSKHMTTTGPYHGEHGNFWATALDIKGSATQTQSNNTVQNNRFLNLGGWAVASTWESHLTITQNYATDSEGMGCGNYVSHCTISDNVSENALDAHFYVNGASSGQTDEDVLIAGNTGTGNSNGAGIDVSASSNVTVEKNVLSGNKNWCIEIGKSKNSYRESVPYLPSDHVTITGNTCNKNGVYQGWPMNSEIFIGEQYAHADDGVAYRPGDVATFVTVRKNTFTTQEPQGRGVYVGYGAASVTLDENQFSGCGGSIPCAYPRLPVIRIQELGTRDLTITNNHQDAQFPTTYIYLGSGGPYTISGNDMLIHHQ